MKPKTLAILTGVAVVLLAASLIIFIHTLSSENENENKVCVIGDNGECLYDITEEFEEGYSPDYVSHECGKNDRYYKTYRYICVKNITQTNNTFYVSRGADRELTSYFTEIDGNTFIYNSKDLTLEENHQYHVVELTQLGYCHGPSKIVEITEINSTCNQCSESPSGIPMGYCPN